MYWVQVMCSAWHPEISWVIPTRLNLCIHVPSCSRKMRSILKRLWVRVRVQDEDGAPQVVSMSVPVSTSRQLHLDFCGFRQVRSSDHRIGWWENLQETPIFDGKNPWVSCRFSQQNQSIDQISSVKVGLEDPSWPKPWGPFRVPNTAAWCFGPGLRWGAGEITVWIVFIDFDVFFHMFFTCFLHPVGCCRLSKPISGHDGHATAINSCTSWQAGRALLDAGASFAIVATGQLRQNPQWKIMEFGWWDRGIYPVELQQKKWSRDI